MGYNKNKKLFKHLDLRCLNNFLFLLYSGFFLGLFGLYSFLQFLKHFLLYVFLAALLTLTRPSSSAGACSTLPSMRSPSKLLASAETLMKTRIVPRMRRQTFIPVLTVTPHVLCVD